MAKFNINWNSINNESFDSERFSINLIDMNSEPNYDSIIENLVSERRYEYAEKTYKGKRYNVG